GGDIIRLDDNVASDAKYLGRSKVTDLWALPLLIAQKYNIPVLFNAPGVPFAFLESQKKFMTELLRNAQYVSVRDEISREFLREAGYNEDVHVIPDTIMLVRNCYSDEMLSNIFEMVKQRNQLPEKYFVFQTNTIDLISANIQDYVNLIDTLQERFQCPAVLMPIGYVHDDMAVLNDINICANKKYHMIQDKLSPAEMLSVISQAKYFVGTSLHGNITAHAFDVSAMALNPGLTKLVGYYHLIGLESYVFSDVEDCLRFSLAPVSIPAEKKQALLTRIEQHFDQMASLLSSEVNRAVPDSSFTELSVLLIQELAGKWEAEVSRRNYFATVYFAGESDFSEDNKLILPWDPQEATQQWALQFPEGTRQVRFDPVEGSCCIVGDLTISIGSYKLIPAPLNGILVGDYVAFNSDDPQFLIKIPEGLQDEIKISCSVLPFKKQDNSMLAGIFLQVISTTDEKNTLLLEIQNQLEQTKQHLIEARTQSEKAQDQLSGTLTQLRETQAQLAEAMMRSVKTQNQLTGTLAQLEETQAQLAEARIQSAQTQDQLTKTEAQFFEAQVQLTWTQAQLTKTIRTYENAFFWKITKPARKVCDVLKHLPKDTKAYKFMWIAKHNGLKVALRKTRQHISNAPITYESLELPPYDDGAKLKVIQAKLSVIIPAYNGGSELPLLLKNLKNQKGIADIERIVVDSGSQDDTVQCAEASGATVVQTSQAEFSHSYSRNLGASKATGEYLLFMTQDALPSGELWLYHLLRPIISGEVVAVSCREIPREDSSLFSCICMWNHERYMEMVGSDRIMSMPAVQNADTLRKNGQLNDVTCLIKKEIFDRYQYRGNYAEDLDLGIRLIKDGYRLALLSSEQVIHSHNRPAFYHLKRSVVDTLQLNRILPDMPIGSITADTAISRIVTGYALLGKFVEYLLGSKACDEATETYFGRVLPALESICRGAVSFPEQQKDTSEMEDKNLREYILGLQNINPAFGDTLLGFELVGYARHNLKTYMLQITPVVDTFFNKQVCEVLTNIFCIYSGNILAAYMKEHTGDCLYDFGQKLCSGV
ncbi:MAG TPA: polysaccharide pyruvyl transferase family protein, partial [Syntrophomonas sp.]|nr:polysaccharide pyruvyl transferase family protein [Syntrophomonas sp.]